MAVFVPVQVQCDGCPKTINASCRLQQPGPGGIPLGIPVSHSGDASIEGWIWPSYGTPMGSAVLCPECRKARGV